ncbi:MAG TPA: EamA family transporter [Ktedonobacteraceae bacterium]|nr:EamA family transporter [Ktedonobacteraceae bacterium]
MLSMTSSQAGSALAKELFPLLGPLGIVGLRVSWAALFLFIIWRKHTREHYGWKAYGLAALFGLALGSMNLSFYLSMSQIPLGLTVTIEFLGPLTLAIVLSRKLLDLLWVLLALGGILLLAPIGALGGSALSVTGIILALLAGVFWAAYILLSSRVGKVFPGGTGLAFATLSAAIVLLPLGIAQARGALLQPLLVLAGAGVGLLSTALPYSLEMEALRRLPSRVFSVLLSLSPAIASLMGFIILHEHLSWRDVAAIALISLASVGVIVFQKTSGPTQAPAQTTPDNK